MKDKIVITLEQNYEAKIAQHKLNIDIMMANPRAIPEHENFSEAIDKELEQLANAHDKLQALKEYFQMLEEKKKDDYTLIKSKDPGLPSYTFFWMKEGKLISPYFGKENDALKWKHDLEKKTK